MNQFLPSMIVASVMLLAGCSSSRQTFDATRLPIHSHALIVQNVRLSNAKPTAQLGQYTIRLVTIADNGTTQIRVIQTDAVLSARPGQCFTSYEFGQEGLRLVSASKSRGTASMISRGCISH
jgi:hypothetical protein